MSLPVTVRCDGSAGDQRLVVKIGLGRANGSEHELVLNVDEVPHPEMPGRGEVTFRVRWVVDGKWDGQVAGRAAAFLANARLDLSAGVAEAL